MNVIPMPSLARALRAVMRFASDDATRPHLCGARLVARGALLEVQATDGHRLAIVRLMPVHDGELDMHSFTLPTESIKALLPWLAMATRDARIQDVSPTTTLVAEDDYADFSHGDAKLRVATRVDSYPELEKIVPAEPGSGIGQGPLRIGLNAKYMSDAAACFKILGPGGRVAPLMNVCFPTAAREPMRMEAGNLADGVASAVVVVMPVLGPSEPAEAVAP